jgi:hypothetical protein
MRNDEIVFGIDELLQLILARQPNCNEINVHFLSTFKLASPTLNCKIVSRKALDAVEIAVPYCRVLNYLVVVGRHQSVVGLQPDE